MLEENGENLLLLHSLYDSLESSRSGTEKSNPKGVTYVIVLLSSHEGSHSKCLPSKSGCHGCLSELQALVMNDLNPSTELATVSCKIRTLMSKHE